MSESETKAANALRENQEKKGQYSYYYAHTSKGDLNK
jgi:hypothetical protein